MEKREHPRMVVSHMQVDVADGLGCCSAIVQDVSRTGLCLADLTKRFGKNIDTFTAVASSESHHFKFRVRPRWEQVGGLSKRMGVEIDEPSGPWIDYILLLESRRKK